MMSMPVEAKTAEPDSETAQRRPVTIVMYHSVDPEVDAYTISPDAFLRQIRFLKRHFAIIRLHDIESALNDTSGSARKLVITFDDAFLDFLEVAYPVLAEHEVPSTVFVPTGYVGGHNDWDAAHPSYRRKRLMTKAQLRTLWQGGLVDFGSHTVTHARMSDLSTEDLHKETAESKGELETLLGVPVTMFAYPYGQLDDISEQAVEAVRAAGYRSAVTTHWGAWNSVDQLLRLRRIYFQEDDSDRVLGLKATGLYDWRSAKERVGHAVRSVRRKLGG